MNSLAGTIKAIQTDKELSIVTVELLDQTFLKSIVIDTAETSSQLKIGNSLSVLFKETEVAITTSFPNTISTQNIITGTIQSIEKEILVSNVTIQTDAGLVKAMISTDAVQQLPLTTGQQVYALVKLNELILSF